ncbi:MAG: hypothetical protein AAF467_16125 [Actinomycetota bacterium]
MRLLPIFKPADWNGPERGALVHLWLGDADDPLVFVAYGWEDDEDLSYVTSHSDEPDNVVRKAFSNLEQTPAHFDVIDKGEARLVVGAGHPFAAERVLSEAFMARVHDALGHHEVIVSIPRRGAMLACASNCSPDARQVLLDLHREGCRSASPNNRITDQLIVYRSAVKSTFLPVDEHGDVFGWHVRP